MHYHLRLQLMGALRQLTVRCPAAIDSGMQHGVVSVLLDQLKDEPPLQLRLELALTLDAIVEHSERAAAQVNAPAGKGSKQ